MSNIGTFYFKIIMAGELSDLITVHHVSECTAQILVAFWGCSSITMATVLLCRENHIANR